MTKTDIRVRYEETDRMGVVYYANYFVYFEVARTDFFKKMGFSYREMEDEKKLRFMVVEAKCSYKAPATYDDLITVATSVTKMRNTSMGFQYTVKRGNALIATGESIHVFTDSSGKPVRIPEKILKAFEKGLTA